ncbi:MAG: glycosyltransferase family 39 protein [Anaerolineales bacterium]|nr:MAG: glycosyltransferase family 39 protein [Anaerolineales bacterium]
MKNHEYILLAFLGLAFILIASIFQSSPGYMDADYYMAGGISLANGSGFNDFFLWNYLDKPDGIPHPSHSYWMPMASLVSALGMIITGVDNFVSARLFFLVIASAIAPLTACLSYTLHRNRKYALLAGITATIPGYYLAYLGTTDTFALYMVLGCTWLVILGQPARNEILKYFFIGLVSGFLHLCRADGIVWIILGAISVFMSNINFNTPQITNKTYRAILVVALVGGYLFIMGPWMLRNLSSFGTALSPGGLRTLWLISYDDLYAYPGDKINITNWMASGIPNILSVRWHALLNNLQNAIAVQGSIYLIPLMIMGLWRSRNHNSVKIGFCYWVITLLIMTFIFPHVGWRGGFFHSGAAVQPLLWAVVPVGLAEFVKYGVRIRRWDWKQAWKFFSFSSVMLLVVLTFMVAGYRLTNFNLTSHSWDQSATIYSIIDAELENIGAAKEDIVMVNNPPGYYVAARRPAIPIPNGNLEDVLAAAEDYGGSYLILEPNHPEGLDNFYKQLENEIRLVHVNTIQDVQIYRINSEE